MNKLLVVFALPLSRQQECFYLWWAVYILIGSVWISHTHGCRQQ